MKRTKIICTIGPASDSKTVLRQLISNGMNVARLNFSHNVHEYHLKVIKTVRLLSKELKRPIGIVADMQGPRIRLGDLPKKGVNLKKGQKLVISTEEKVLKNEISVTYEKMHQDVQVGDRILIADGLIELTVNSVKGKKIITKVKTGGTIFSHKGLNLPDSKVSLSALTEKDKTDLDFAIKNKADFIAISFVRDEHDVYNLRTLINKTVKKYKFENYQPKVIVKIERKDAIHNLDRIIEVTDVVMIARGDLGIELNASEVPILQKMIIDKCIKAAKPVIVATQMLESMMKNPRPTRAEVSDVANAVIDHTDAVMLSGETALGNYPKQAVSMLNKISLDTEKSVYDDYVIQEKTKKINNKKEELSRTIKALCEESDIQTVVLHASKLEIATLVSRYRPEVALYVCSDNQALVNQLNLVWSVSPYFVKSNDVESFYKKLIRDKVIKKQSKVLLVKNADKKIEDIRIEIV
ncbi:pyruvate kinase [Candidatus Falkowbacteria bacterium]|jgi:pyruvate kinase|nr:pyruvate kinase [Candidatus Falkowbacteria bacterium]MBT7007240.1 pyruvate kinase [Candidatus Falkowbacteria bacterium]